MNLMDKLKGKGVVKDLAEPGKEVGMGIAEHIRALKEMGESNRRLADEMRDLRDLIEKLKMAVDALNVTMERRRIY